MKTAVSIPDDVFAEADVYAHDHGLSRSALYAEALREYLAKHGREGLTRRVNEAVDAVGQCYDARAIDYNRDRMREVDW